MIFVRHPARLIAALALVACSGGSQVPAAAAPASAPRNVRELTEADTVLRPVAFAAAAYLKQIVPRAGIGFQGVSINRVELRDLSEDIGRRMGFVMRPKIACVATIRAGSAPPMSPSQADNCRMENANVAYAFSMFRRAGDSAFVGATGTEVRGGRPESLQLCMVLVWTGQAWTGVGKRGTSAVECGR